MFPVQGHHVLTFFESFCLLLACAQSFLYPNKRGYRAREIKWHIIANIHHRPIKQNKKCVRTKGTTSPTSITGLSDQKQKWDQVARHRKHPSQTYQNFSKVGAVEREETAQKFRSKIENAFVLPITAHNVGGRKCFQKHQKVLVHPV
jgi:hypothetical protein